MDFKKDYKDWIAEQKELWIGRKVIWEGCEYTVVDVDYNGALLIDKPAMHTNTTAVPMWMVK